jgi:hypothetical protein
MIGVYGVSPDLHDRLVARSLEISGVRVIDALYLFLSKCHCLIGLDQTGRQDEKHLRMLCLILPLYFSHLTEQAREGKIGVRGLIKEIKLFRKLCNTSFCRRALVKVEVATASLLPVAEIRRCGLPVLERFANSLPG